MKLKVTVDGKAYEVEVEVADEQPTPVRYVAGASVRSAAPAPVAAPRSSGGDGGRAVEDEAKACRSPLAGVVNKVNIEVGQEVAQDEEILVLEAMKMLTTITSPCAGKVKAIEVAQGDAVKQGQLLVEFE